MEEIKKEDLDWMIHLCEPTPSQELSLLHCPFARESDTFKDSIGHDSNHIFMLSVPSNDDQVEETQPFDVGIENVVVVLDASDSDNEMVKLGDVDSVEIMYEEERSRDGSFKRGLGSSKIEKECIFSVGDKVTRNEKATGDCVNEGLSGKMIELCVGEKLLGNGTVDKDCVNGDVRAGTSSIGFDEFAYSGNADVNEKQGRRKLPESVQGGEDNNVVEKETDFYEILKMLDSVEGDEDGEEVDFVETVKERGILFPRPRWWHPDW